MMKEVIRLFGFGVEDARWMRWTTLGEATYSLSVKTPMVSKWSVVFIFIIVFQAPERDCDLGGCIEAAGRGSPG